MAFGLPTNDFTSELRPRDFHAGLGNDAIALIELDGYSRGFGLGS